MHEQMKTNGLSKWKTKTLILILKSVFYIVTIIRYAMVLSFF